MTKTKKLSLGCLTITTATIVPIVATTACGSKSHANLLEKGDKDKQTNVWSNLPILKSQTNWKPEKPIGDKNIISNIQLWMKQKNIKGFNADVNFVKNSAAPFNRSPRTIIANSPKIKNINNLPPKEFGMEEIVEYIKQKYKVTPTIELIKKSRDDSTGELGVKLKIKNSLETTMDFIVSGFTHTKDIELKGEDYKTVSEIIKSLDNVVHLSFKKSISIMTPQDLKNELIDLYNDTNGGRLTIIGTYKGTESAIALDRRIMLEKLINAFGDVSKTKRGVDNLIKFGVSMSNKISSFDEGFGTIIPKYMKILDKPLLKGVSETTRGDYIAGLFANISPKVFNQFPDLIKLFDNVANGVKNMPMVQEWAKDNALPGEIDKLNYTLIEWVIVHGSLKNKK